jgi:hypothetical protein
MPGGDLNFYLGVGGGAALAGVLLAARRYFCAARQAGPPQGGRKRQRLAPPLRHAQPRAMTRKEAAGKGFSVANPLQLKRR